jgi:hypothetical protein
MAKMIVNYAVKVLKMQPDISKECSSFKESIAQYSNEMKDFMTLSCQLSIMGIHAD